LTPTSQLPAEWARTYGGANVDEARWIQQISDGGYVVAGYTESYQTNGVAWVVKLDSAGAVVWENTYGGPAGKGACCIDETFTQQGIADGYVVAGGPADDPLWSEFGVLRLNPDGTKVWQRVFGGFETTDTAYAIEQTSDRGFVISGYTESFNPPDGGHGWILKLDANADITWEYVYGGPAGMGARSIQETFDQQGNPDGYIVANGPSGASGGDLGLLRLNPDGTRVWQKLYHTAGGAGHVKSARQTSDGGFVLAGNAYFETGSDDFWVLSLNSDGSLLWSKTYGGSNVDTAYSIEETSDNGFVVAGSTKSYGAGNEDFWVIKLNPGGTVAWQRTYGGAYADAAYSVQETADGGLVVAGITQSFGAGSEDAWVLKLDANGEIPGCSAMGTSNAIGSDLFPEVNDVTWWTPFASSADITDITWWDPVPTLAEITNVCGVFPPIIQNTIPRQQEASVPNIPTVMNWLNSALGYTCPSCIQTVRYGRVRLSGENFGPNRLSGDQVRIGDYRSAAPAVLQYDTDADPYTVENIYGGVSLYIGPWSDDMIGIYLYPEPGQYLYALYGPNVGLHWLDTWLGMWVVKDNGGAPVASNVEPIKVITPLPD
jgi:uncharacterized delta-60 repeat protein